jgi:hypothetical protein
MMKSVASLMIVLGALASGHAFARSPIYNDTTYLGGAYNLADCAQRAGLSGFERGIFGAGYDANGVFYPYWNACFGSGRRQAEQVRQNYYFYPYVQDGYDADRCLSTMRYVRGVRDCKMWANSKYIIECSPDRAMTYDEALAVERDMQSYNCVNFVDGPRERR